MFDAHTRLPLPGNEPALPHAPDSAERASLQVELDRILSGAYDIPLIIGGKELRTGRTSQLGVPHERERTLGVWHRGGAEEARAAIEAALAAKPAWEAMPFAERAAIFRRAAALVSGKYRAIMDAASMVGQSKTIQQAEIDAVCETSDFFRWNASLAERLYDQQPDSGVEEWNRSDYRPLEGFVYAVSPFNFTAIAANLAAAPALMGNVVVWKPASSSILSNWLLMTIYEEAGLPPGVINFVPGDSGAITEAVLASPHFAGLHFTGSTAVFNRLWKGIAANLEGYRTYPRIVGETGGKDFVLVLPDADPDIVVSAVVRGAFEYQGQKCSAASRLYLPKSRASDLLARLVDAIKAIRMGDPADFRNFMGAVIDEAAFDGHAKVLSRAQADPAVRILGGGGADKARGFFVEPTLLLCADPRSPFMSEEIFGPVLSAYVYDDTDLEAAYALIDSTSPYGLTGAILGTERGPIERAQAALRHAAGNLYINDKPTGAVVGRQPFGGARGSGTNDKAGSLLNLLRWTSPRTIKENFSPASDWRYPHMGSEA